MQAFPIDAVRRQFPSVSKNAQRIYLDNPAGTQIPARVSEAVAKAMTAASSNLGGFFPDSEAADATWLAGHEAGAELLGAASYREIIVGQSMTALTFHMSRCLGPRFKPGDEIVVTRMDHEGNVSPWLALAKDRGLTVRFVPFNRETFRIEPEDLAAALSSRTRLAAINYASNLTGSINEIATLVGMARKAGALTYVDAVQFAPHAAVDVKAIGCDFLVCSAYKFFGPHLGVLYGREDLLSEIEAYKVRCASDDLPGRFEMGTPQTELLAGLAAAVDYLAWVGAANGVNGGRRSQVVGGYSASTHYERQLAGRLIEGLRAMPGVTIHGIVNPNRYADRVPTVSFTHPGRDTVSIAKALGKQGICVWSGHNYALEVVRHLGVEEEAGVVRIGIAHYNSMDEIDRTVAAVRKALA
ncbi:MAG: cysteine desulfurase-like protein [Alphaproteobacteria bacterium]|nr:cysteine desulfurase-like protein [Alphaproteobacteria bacterium]